MVGGMVQAAGVTDTTEKGGVAVNLSSDTAKGATASGTGAVAEGEGATASGTNAVAIGNTAKSDSTGAIAIGNNAKTITVKETVKKDDGTEKERIYPASHSIAIGTDSQAIQSKSIAIGYGALAQKGDNVAIGNTAKAKGNRAIATGAYTEAGEYSLATGYNALANGQHSIAIGDRAKASKLVGKEETPIDYAIVMGYKARANTGALSLGREADAGEFAIAQGWKAKAPGYGSIANGVSTNSAGQWAISIGGFAKNTEKSPYAVSIGTSAYVGDLSDEIKKFTIKETPTRLISDMEEVPTEYVNVDGSPASGDESSISKEEYDNPQEGSLAIGWNTGASGFEATAIGQGTRAYGKRSVAIGLSSRAIEESSVAIGQQTVAAAIDALAVGRFANAFAYGSIAMGARTEIGSKAANAVALGMWARTDQTNSVALGSYSSTEGIDVADGKAKYSNEAVKGNVGVISVGTEAYSLEFGKDNLNIPDIKRRIVNVAGGINPNDAVNVKQLTAVAESPVYIYSGGIKDSQTGDYKNNPQVTPGANQKYTINNLRFNFTDGLTATNEVVVTGENANNVIKVGISDEYMQSIKAEVKKAADSAAVAKQSETNAGKSAEAAKASETNAKASEDKAKASETNAKASEDNAKASETNAKASEDNAKASEDNAKASEDNAKASEDNAKASEDNAKASEDNAKASEDNAKASEDNAKASEDNAKASEDNAKASEDNAKASEDNAKASETNAGKSAKEVKDIADALKGAGIEAGKTEDGSTGSTAVGGESSIGKDSDGSVAIGKDASVGDQSSNSTAIGNGANVKDSAKEGTAIGNGSTIGDKSSGSTAIGKDANVGTDATNSTAIGNGSKVNNGAENSTAVGTGSTVGAGATNGTAIGNGTEIGEGIDNATAIGNGAKVTGNATNSVAIGAGSVADRPNTVSVGRVVEKDGKVVEETRVITHVGNGLVAKGSTDAVNGGQLYEVAQQVGNNSQAIRDLRRDSRKGDAMNAALAALKPIAYNPAEPTQIMAGIGTYRGEQAVALGAAHYVNGRTMLNAGVAYAGSSNMMANVGVTWRVGQGEVPEDVPTDAQAVAGLNNRVKSLEGLVQEQRDYMKKQQAQVDEQKKELEAQRNQIEMQNKQMKQQQEIIDALMARLH